MYSKSAIISILCPLHSKTEHIAINITTSSQVFLGFPLPLAPSISSNLHISMQLFLKLYGLHNQVSIVCSSTFSDAQFSNQCINNLVTHTHTLIVYSMRHTRSFFSSHCMYSAFRAFFSQLYTTLSFNDPSSIHKQTYNENHSVSEWDRNQQHRVEKQAS